MVLLPKTAGAIYKNPLLEDNSNQCSDPTKPIQIIHLCPSSSAHSCTTGQAASYGNNTATSIKPSAMYFPESYVTVGAEEQLAPKS